MREDEQAAWLVQYMDDPRQHWNATQRQLSAIAGGGLVGGKSALLNRLIQGKAALRDRPPCSFSYPWYEAVEATRPVMITTVGLSGVMSLGSAMKGTGGADQVPEVIDGVKCLVINQSAYVISGANEAAKTLAKIARQMMESPDGLREVDDWRLGGNAKREAPALTRKHPLWDELLAAYEAGPEFEVRHGQWPSWRVFMGTRVGVADEAWGLECVAKAPFSQLAEPQPMDLAFAGLNAKLVVATLAQHEADENDSPEDDSARRIRDVLCGQDPEKKDGRPMRALNIMADGAHAPKRATVRLSTSCWMMEKSERVVWEWVSVPQCRHAVAVRWSGSCWLDWMRWNRTRLTRCCASQAMSMDLGAKAAQPRQAAESLTRSSMRWG